MDNIQRASAAFKAICDYMDESGLKYEKRIDKNIAFVTIASKDFPVSLMFSVNARLERVSVYCQLPFEIKREREFEVLSEIAAINNRIACGKFCLYRAEKLCTFENCEYIAGLGGFDCEYGRAVVAPAYVAVEEYAQKLYAVNKG